MYRCLKCKAHHTNASLAVTVSASRHAPNIGNNYCHTNGIYPSLKKTTTKAQVILHPENDHCFIDGEFLRNTKHVSKRSYLRIHILSGLFNFATLLPVSSVLPSPWARAISSFTYVRFASCMKSQVSIPFLKPGDGDTKQASPNEYLLDMSQRS